MLYLLGVLLLISIVLSSVEVGDKKCRPVSRWHLPAADRIVHLICIDQRPNAMDNWTWTWHGGLAVVEASIATYSLVSNL